MSMNVDMLKMLYSSSVNNNSNSLNKIVENTSGQDSFLEILSDAILGDSSNSANKDVLDSIIESNKDEDKNQNNDLLTSLILMMQQGIPMQGNYVDYESLLNNLNIPSNLNLGIDKLNNVIQNISSTTNLSNENLEDLILGLQNQNAQQNNIIKTANNQVENEVVTALNAENENSFAGRNFPKEILQSINAVRQAHDFIRSKIEQTKNVVGIEVVDSNKSTLTAENVNKGYSDIQVSVISNGAVQNGNSVNADNAVQASKGNNVAEEVIVASEANSLGKEVIDNNKELDNSIINESLLNVNGVDVQSNSKTIKINDESSIIKESVMEQIKDQIVLMKSNGKQTVTMQLTPENLGKLDIKMVFEKGNLSVEIIASNPKAHSLILSNISELKSVLQNSIADRTFINMETSKQAFEQNANQNNHGHNSQHSHQERHDGNEREYQPIYSETLDDNNGIDFFAELSRIRDYRFNSISQV